MPAPPTVPRLQPPWSPASPRGAATAPVFQLLKLERLSCTFREEKRVALLARPLTSTGTITFDRGRGIARSTLTPKAEHVVVTRTAADPHRQEDRVRCRARPSSSPRRCPRR